MSLHTSLLLIEGDYTDRLGEIFTAFEYHDTGRDRNAMSLEEAVKLCEGESSQTLVLKAICLLRGWTVILDPETVILDPGMVMAVDSGPCCALSRSLDTRIFEMVCEGASSSYGFALYDRGKMRCFLTIEGDRCGYEGDSLPEEAGIDLANLSEDGILAIMRKTAFDYHELNSVSSFVIKTLDESAMEPAGMPESVPSKKPWWKFW